MNTEPMETDPKNSPGTVIGVIVADSETSDFYIHANDEQEYLIAGGLDPDRARALLRKRISVHGRISDNPRGKTISIISLDLIQVDPALAR